MKKTSCGENKLERPTIWVVTCLNKGVVNERVFGWYASEEEAVKAVVENQADLFECYYHYAVIEEVTDGIHGAVITEIWFRWDAPPNTVYGHGRENKSWWANTDKPEWSKSIINWSMG